MGKRNQEESSCYSYTTVAAPKSWIQTPFELESRWRFVPQLLWALNNILHLVESRKQLDTFGLFQLKRAVWFRFGSQVIPNLTFPLPFFLRSLSSSSDVGTTPQVLCCQSNCYCCVCPPPKSSFLLILVIWVCTVYCRCIVYCCILYLFPIFKWFDLAAGMWKWVSCWWEWLDWGGENAANWYWLVESDVTIAVLSKRPKIVNSSGGARILCAINLISPFVGLLMDKIWHPQCKAWG